MEKALEVEEYAMDLRRRIHQHPELGMQEFVTTELIKTELGKMGAKVAELDIPTGVVAEIRGSKPGRGLITAIRCDIDALPIREETGKPYTSQNEGVMHACGHDGHTAILLGTAKALMGMREQFSGVVRLIFQPAEETLRGAEYMLKANTNLLDDVESIIALHSEPELNLGQIGLCPGRAMASADVFQIKMIGKSAHAGQPFHGINPLVAAALATSALQGVVPNEISPMEQAVLSVCKLKGGNAYNIIPSEAYIGGTVRCFKRDIREGLKTSIIRIADNTAKLARCQCDVDYQMGVPPLYNDTVVGERVMKAAWKIVGPENYVQTPCKLTSEDFAVFTKRVPGALLRLGVTPIGEKPISLHNEGFDFNDDVLSIGVSVFLQYVLDTNI